MEKTIIDKIMEIVKKTLDAFDFQLVELYFKKGRSKEFIKVLIDKAEGGITSKECVKANKEISLALDNSGVLTQSYVLEVSSPGIDRPLVTKEDFQRKKGKKVKIETTESLKGIAGAIVDVTDEAVIIEKEENKERENVPFKLIKKAKIKIEW
ncbi:MAG: ribosome maturation factor RimP [Candidatus Omnitrophota bacterium]